MTKPIVYVITSTPVDGEKVLHSAFVNYEEAMESLNNIRRVLSRQKIELEELPLHGINHDLDLVNFTFSRELNQKD